MRGEDLALWGGDSLFTEHYEEGITFALQTYVRGLLATYKQLVRSDASLKPHQSGASLARLPAEILNMIFDVVASDMLCDFTESLKFIGGGCIERHEFPAAASISLTSKAFLCSLFRCTLNRPHHLFFRMRRGTYDGLHDDFSRFMLGKHDLRNSVNMNLGLHVNKPVRMNLRVPREWSSNGSIPSAVSSTHASMASLCVEYSTYHCEVGHAIFHDVASIHFSRTNQSGGCLVIQQHGERVGDVPLQYEFDLIEE